MRTKHQLENGVTLDTNDGVCESKTEEKNGRAHIGTDEILSLQGRLFSPDEIEECSQRTAGMAILYGCQRMERPCTTVKTVHTIPMTLFPSAVPRDVVDDATKLQPYFNTMLKRIADDKDFMFECLKDIIGMDDFFARIWKIYEKSQTNTYGNKIDLGIFRNDFMFEAMENSIIEIEETVQTPALSKCSTQYRIGDKLRLRQVEFNGQCVGTAGILNHVPDCHRYALSMASVPYNNYQMPSNSPIDGIAEALIKAWKLYGNKRAAILFVVQDVPFYLNPDQRWVERKIFENNPEVHVIYRSYTMLKDEIQIRKTGTGNTLLISNTEVAVVYYRVGYDSSHFKDKKEYDALEKMELSMAIKCPPIKYFLAQMKKIQQVLYTENCVGRFVADPDVADKISRTFVPQYTLDKGVAGDKNLQMAKNDPGRYVLKHYTEGGGNKYFGSSSVKSKLETLEDTDDRTCFTLMERIRPVYQHNIFIRPGSDVAVYPVTNELGIYGILLTSDEDELLNCSPGMSLKTKTAYDDEAGLSAFTGYVDSPFYIE